LYEDRCHGGKRPTKIAALAAMKRQDGGDEASTLSGGESNGKPTTWYCHIISNGLVDDFGKPSTRHAVDWHETLILNTEHLAVLDLLFRPRFV
jgi:hypothetical protein